MQPHEQSSPAAEQESIQYYVLEGLFPPTHVFALNLALGTLIHLYQDEQTPYPLILGEQQCTERERDLLRPLLVYHPQWVPYEVIHVSYFQGFDRLSDQLIAQAQAKLETLREEKLWDAEMKTTRNRRIDHYLHTASKRIVDFLVKEGVGTVIIGKNPLWKQEAGMGRKNNQNFVSIPHARFIDMLSYKAALVGIQVEVREESYTSQASFLDLDPIPTFKPNDEEEHVFSGKRIGKRKRLYRSKDGRTICADVNGAYNILRKSRPDAFSKAKGVAGYVVHPVRLAV